MDDAPLPFKPGDWAAGSGERVARVKRVYWDGDEALLDLVIYDWRGEKVGRESPACGGPRTFEPACTAAYWERIAEPTFPIGQKWVPNDQGGVTARMWAGDRLPPGAYVPTPRKRGVGRQRDYEKELLRLALKQIADGDNDARATARKALGLKLG